MNDGCPGDPLFPARMLAGADYLADNKIDGIGRQTAFARIDHDIRSSTRSGDSFASLTIGLIDPYRLTQDCLAKGLINLDPEIAISAFTTAKDCLSKAPGDFDIIVYYLHGNDIFETAAMQSIAVVCHTFSTVPVIILSDADCTRLSSVTRAVLKSGARGFVSARTSGLPITLAVARLIKEGGTFVPTYLLPIAQPGNKPKQRKHLTSREDEVLGQIQQGKANKIIAYELGLSESTVKVHVRNIMRKMGATNRTQVAYIAQDFARDIEDSATTDAELLQVIAPLNESPPHLIFNESTQFIGTGASEGNQIATDGGRRISLQHLSSDWDPPRTHS